MATNIEQKFFETFKIKPLCQIPDQYCGMKNVYEEITSDILLQLEDMLLKKHIQVEYCCYDGNYYCSCTIPLCNGKADNKKDAFLEMLICVAENFLGNSDMDGEEEIYKQVQSLFTEVGE